ncbi:MAG: hypothetical protein C4339_05095 [Nitrososphaerota archaeon]
MEGALTGISPRLSGLLALNGIRTLEDLARLDPYDVRFKGWEEELLKAVNRARAALADRVVREVSVSEAIVVRTSKDYDPELTLRAIEARLGLFSPYVVVERRGLDGAYEFRIMRNAEQPLSYGPWLEYKLNARLYAGYIRSRLMPRPSAEGMKELLRRLRAPLEEPPLLLAMELLRALLLSDRLHVLVIEEGEGFSDYAMALLEAMGYQRISLGALEARELAERLSGPGVVPVEGLEAMRAEEQRVLRGLLRGGRASVQVKGEEVEFELHARTLLIAREEQGLPRWLLGEVPAVLRLPRLSGRARLALAEARVQALPRPSLAELRLEPLPGPVKEELARLLDERPELGARQALTFLQEVAKARAREMALSEVGAQHYQAALELLRRLLAIRRRGRRGARA